MSTKARRRLGKPIGWIAPVVLILLWQLVIVAGILKYKYLPSPVAVFKAFLTLAKSGQLLANTGHTLEVTIVAWVIASVAGIAIGAAIGLSLPLWRSIMASVDVLRSIPIIAMIPVGVIIFGFTFKLEVVVAIYGALWPVVVNTVSGVRQTQMVLLDVAAMLRMSRFERLRKIILPAGLPFILVGLRLGLGLALVLSVVTEIVGTPKGIGYALISAEQAIQPAEMFAYIVMVGIVGYLMNALFVWTSWRLFPSERAQDGAK